jgi:hypothetical protein
MSVYLSKLDAKVYALCEELRVPRPLRCVGEHQCLELDAYLELLVKTATVLELQWVSGSTTEWGSDQLTDEVGMRRRWENGGSPTVYLVDLEAQWQAQASATW